MSKVLVSASHFDTLCQDAWKLFEDNGIDVVFDPAKEFPAYTTEEIENHPDREDIVAALIGMDDFRDERKYQALPNLKAVAKFGVGVDNIDGEPGEEIWSKSIKCTWTEFQCSCRADSSHDPRFAQTCNASSQGYGKRSLDQIHRK